MTTKVTVSIPRDSATGEDVVVNTFHFKTPTTGLLTPGQVDSFTEALRKFYDVAAPPAASRVTNFMSGLLNSPARVRFYTIPALVPNIPFAERDMALTLPTQNAGSDLPEEVAVCLSYRRTPVAGQNPRHRRGRIFVGPLRNSTVTLYSNQVRVTSSFTDALVNAAKRLQTDVRLINVGFEWIVWSPTTLTEHVIEEVYVDDAFDTMRSRGGRPTIRNLLTV